MTANSEMTGGRMKKCSCVHGDSDPYCPDPECPNYVAAYHVGQPASAEAGAEPNVTGVGIQEHYVNITNDVANITPVGAEPKAEGARKEGHSALRFNKGTQKLETFDPKPAAEVEPSGGDGGVMEEIANEIFKVLTVEVCCQCGEPRFPQKQLAGDETKVGWPACVNENCVAYGEQMASAAYRTPISDDQRSAIKGILRRMCKPAEPVSQSVTFDPVQCAVHGVTMESCRKDRREGCRAVAQSGAEEFWHQYYREDYNFANTPSEAACQFAEAYATHVTQGLRAENIRLQHNYEQADEEAGREREQVTALREQLEQWKSWGVVEVAVRNPQVADYCKHWEGRVEAVEQLPKVPKEILRKAGARKEARTEK